MNVDDESVFADVNANVQKILEFFSGVQSSGASYGNLSAENVRQVPGLNKRLRVLVADATPLQLAALSSLAHDTNSESLDSLFIGCRRWTRWMLRDEAEMEQSENGDTGAGLGGQFVTAAQAQPGHHGAADEDEATRAIEEDQAALAADAADLEQNREKRQRRGAVAVTTAGVAASGQPELHGRGHQELAGLSPEQLQEITTFDTPESNAGQDLQMGDAENAPASGGQEGGQDGDDGYNSDGSQVGDHEVNPEDTETAQAYAARASRESSASELTGRAKAAAKVNEYSRRYGLVSFAIETPSEPACVSPVYRQIAKLCNFDPRQEIRSATAGDEEARRTLQAIQENEILSKNGNRVWRVIFVKETRIGEFQQIFSNKEEVKTNSADRGAWRFRHKSVPVVVKFDPLAQQIGRKVGFIANLEEATLPFGGSNEDKAAGTSLYLARAAKVKQFSPSISHAQIQCRRAMLKAPDGTSIWATAVYLPHFRQEDETHQSMLLEFLSSKLPDFGVNDHKPVFIGVDDKDKILQLCVDEIKRRLGEAEPPPGLIATGMPFKIVGVNPTFDQQPARMMPILHRLIGLHDVVRAQPERITSKFGEDFTSIEALEEIGEADVEARVQHLQGLFQLPYLAGYTSGDGGERVAHLVAKDEGAMHRAVRALNAFVTDWGNPRHVEAGLARPRAITKRGSQAATYTAPTAPTFVATQGTAAQAQRGTGSVFPATPSTLQGAFGSPGTGGFSTPATLAKRGGATLEVATLAAKYDEMEKVVEGLRTQQLATATAVTGLAQKFESQETDLKSLANNMDYLVNRAKAEDEARGRSETVV